MSTIREVAARAGVSVTTVSRTLNNRGYISQKMRERISKAMAELNYQPNEVARSLSFQHTKMIGVLVPEIDSPFFRSKNQMFHIGTCPYCAAENILTAGRVPLIDQAPQIMAAHGLHHDIHIPSGTKPRP